MAMDQITEHSFSYYNIHIHIFNIRGHYYNRIYFYTSCNFLYNELVNPSTMFTRWNYLVNLQSMHALCDYMASNVNGCQLMDRSFFEQQNIL